uniref:Junction mediating and regulatory protein, p53 cofactor n=1 Tax=Cyprinus carpio TaxID=7962 RepID=A0A8C2IHF6_CYPCA
MSFAMEDALESGWVSVRPNVFEEKEKHKFVFIVAWNEIEGKFAVTCHDRTVQKRSAARDSLLEGEQAAGDAPPPVQSPGRERAEPGRAELEPPEPDDAPEDSSWAGLFSFQDMRAAHLQLCAVNSDLEPCLPAFPEEQTAVWSVLFGAPELSARDTDALCFQLQVYLGHALDTCGWRILSQVLFPDSDDSEEYYESLSELRRKGFEDALQRAKRHLQQLLEKQRGVERMVELLQLYAEQDEAYGDLVEATTELYHYLLQPFRDMRELAMLRRQQIKISLETERLGPRRVESLRREDEDWQRKAHTAVLSIQDLTVKYFENTARAQKVMYERMRTDQRKFGKAAWGAAVERMEKLQYDVSKETLQLMRAKEICLEQRKHGLREEVHIHTHTHTHTQVHTHLHTHIHTRTHTYTLTYTHTRMHSRYLQFFNYRYLSGTFILTAPEHTMLPLSVFISLWSLFKSRGVWFCSQEICIINHTQKRQGGPDCVSQQALLQDEEEEEEQRLSRVSQERQTTLDRLRSFRQRYPGQVTLKSTRLRLAYSRKRAGARPEQTQTQAASVQTDDALAGVPELRRPESFLSLPPMGGAVVEAPPPDTHTSLPPSRELLLLDSSTSPMSPPPPPPPPPPFSLYINDKYVQNTLILINSSTAAVTSSPMDEVLASLKRGSFHLRKAELRVLAPDPDEDDDNNILAQIRKGVQLRKVRRQERSCRGAMESDPLTRSIHEALRRIKEASPESESESEDETPACTDWES